jgi:hypothetical protein
MVIAAAVLLFQVAPFMQGLPTAQTASAAKPLSVQSSSDQNKLMAWADVPASPNPSATVAPAPTNSQPGSQPAATGASSPNSNSSGTSPASLPAVALDTTEHDALSTIRIPEAPLAKPTPVLRVESLPSRRSWLLLSLAQHGAATFDAYATRDAISHGAVEQNPLMRPFANSDGIYAAIQICPVLLDFASRKMQRSENNFARRTWWLPQSVSTAVYLFSGVHDLHVANQR